MSRHHQIKRLMYVAVLFACMNTVFAATKLIIGPELCLKTHSTDKATQYQLDLGIYHKSNALAYQQRIRQITQYPVNLKYQSFLNAYMVAVGPIANLDALHHLCRQVLGLGPSNVLKKQPSKNIIPPIQQTKPAYSKLIIGVESGLILHASDKTKQYRLDVGVFKDKKNAIAYQQKLQRFIKYPVNIKYQPRLQSFMVVVGPIKGVDALHRTSKEILERAPPVHKHPPAQKNTMSSAMTLNRSYDSKMGKVESKPTYQYAPHPYVGFNTGLLLNTSGVPATYAGLEGTIFTGFGVHLKHNFYMGAEIFGSNSALLRNAYPILLPANPHSGWIYGLHIMPGYWINDLALVYVPIGPVKTYFMRSQDGAEGNTRTGWQIGLGLQDKITKTIDFRLEYLFTDYSKRSGFHRLQESQRAHMYGDQFSLGAVYRFND